MATEFVREIDTRPRRSLGDALDAAATEAMRLMDGFGEAAVARALVEKIVARPLAARGWAIFDAAYGGKP